VKLFSMPRSEAKRAVFNSGNTRSGSLVKTTMLRMAVRISVVVVAVSLLSYSHIMRRLEIGVREQLSLFIAARTQHESQWLDFLDRRLTQLRAEYIERYQAMNGVEPPGLFDRYFKMNEDGTAYPREEYYSGALGAMGDRLDGFSGGIDNHYPLTPDRRLRLVLAMEMLFQHARGIAQPAIGTNQPLTPFIDFYIETPEKDLLLYWPGTPWYPDYKGGYDIATQGDFAKIYDHSIPFSERERSWTGTYRDDVPKIWMVSFTMPIDLNEKSIAGLGVDITLTDINRRLVKNQFPGTTDFIIREDGRLIAHPLLEKEMLEKKGEFYLTKDGDDSLRDVYRLISANPGQTIVDDAANDRLIAVGKITGPGWLFVTIYPKSLMNSTAAGTVFFIFFLGVLSLLVEVGMLWMVLRKRIAQPLDTFVQATQTIAAGDFSAATSALPVTRTDELGLLANSFQDMTESLSAARDKLDAVNVSLENKVAERTAKLEAVNKEMEAFSYSVSHDLRAPLRGVDGWSQALLDDYGDTLDDQAHKYLDTIRSETQRMGQLIDDLLELSRVTRSEMSRNKVDLGALAHTIAERLRKSNPERRVEFIIQPEVFVYGDAPLLEIALTNLFDNAWKFTGGRSLAAIEFGSTFVEGKQAYFVRDNGTGFDMKYAGKLFGAFQRLHKASEFPGTGIGLATVQRIIHRHEGRIWAESKLGEGTTFYFVLKEEP
jgi:signal transduction histidine kinase